MPTDHVAPPAEQARLARWFSRLRPFEAYLGEWTDEIIARRAAVPVAAVVQYRTRLGLPPGTDAARAPRERLKPQYWMRPLGLIPDSAIVEFGAPRTGLPRARQILGVPPVEHGWSHLPPWTDRALDGVPADIPPLVAEVRARPGVAEITRDDPRLRLWFGATGSPAKTLAEALDTYEALDVEPFSRKVYLLRALIAELDGMAGLPLAEELCAVASFVLGRGAPVAIQRYGLDGKPPVPLPDLLPPHRIARSRRVRLLLRRFDRAVEAVHPWLPALDRALAGGAPAAFDPAALAAAATRFGRTPRPARRRRARGPAANADDIARVLRAAGRFPGVFSVPYALRCLARKAVVATEDDVLRAVADMPQVEWVHGGPPHGWFWFPRQRDLMAVTLVIRKILSIGPADLTSFSEGLLRYTKRHEALWVPPEVVASIAAQLPGVRVEGDWVSADIPVDRSVLTSAERAAAEFFEREGFEQRHTRIQEAIVAPGRPRGIMALFMQHSPIIRPTSPGRYALVGRAPSPPRGVAQPATSGWISDEQFPADLASVARLASRLAPEGQHAAVRFRRDRRRVEWELCSLEPSVDVYETVRGLAAATRTFAIVVVHPAGNVAAEGFGQMVEAWRGEDGALEVGDVEPCPEGLWMPPVSG